MRRMTTFLALVASLAACEPTDGTPDTTTEATGDRLRLDGDDRDAARVIQIIRGVTP